MKKTIPLLAVAAAALASGCRYDNLLRTGKFSAAPYSELKCFEQGNDEGFSFKVPACYCQKGILLRYRANKRPDRSVDISYEMERGYLSPEKEDDTKITSHSQYHIDHIVLGGRELPPYSQCSQEDRWIRDLNREMFVKMWSNYQPVIKDLFRICFEDRFEDYMKNREPSD